MTKLRCTSARGKVLPPVRASAGVEALYYRALIREIRDMHDSIEYWLKVNYRKVEPQIVAQDANPADLLNRVMSRLTNQWRTRFNDLSSQLAKRFVNGATQHADKSFSRNLAAEGFAVKFKPTPGVELAMKSSINENVSLIKSIAGHHLEEVEGAVMRSAMAGRDLAALTTELQDRFGVTKRRAALIARDQNNKMTAVINRRRQQDLGITEAIWAHSHGGKHPRKSHVKAGRDRLRYKLSEGAMIDGKTVWPGSEINCRCVARPIIPGFDD